MQQYPAEDHGVEQSKRCDKSNKDVDTRSEALFNYRIE